ncbi:MAG: phenylalanine--tRNA ligase subunit beta [Candidatus Omnitrophota bacterium]|nr:phenylalanine--tRNA ligase subunit beta [Candidatus Omnitrophota bacterium]
MKLTYNWLKDFVDISLKPKELADKLTMAGLEVVSLEEFEGDYVFEIEITSNRPDWLSVIGIAREVSAITGRKLKPTADSRQPTAGSGSLHIKIENKKACPFYSARLIYEVKVGPSPSGIADRLKAIGLRPVNNIVDITNYVLWATGQPLHAFDLDKIVGANLCVRPNDGGQTRRSAPTHRKISVRFAKSGEEIISIDGISRKLSPKILVITDENRPVAIAGIMGGKESQVSEATRNILLESAYFHPLVIRKAARLLGLSSDSSYRFERSVSMGGILDSSDLASSLILKYAGGNPGPLFKAGSDAKTPAKSIIFNIPRANKLLGKDLSAVKIKANLSALGFKTASLKKDTLKITPPAFRQDISTPADILEEVCRVYGYENIPLSLPSIKPSQLPEENIQLIQERAAQTLSSLGFNEVITYSLLSQEALKRIRSDGQTTVFLENPLSQEQEVLRPSLTWGLLNVLARNLELGNTKCAFFEIGNCFSQDSECRFLGIVMNKRGSTTLTTGGLLELKGVLELLLQKIGIKDYKFIPSTDPLFTVGYSSALVTGKEEFGFLGQAKKEILTELRIDESEVIIAGLNLDKLKNLACFSRVYQPLPKYPSVSRDISLIVDETISYQALIDAIKSGNGLESLENIKFKDVYRSEALGKTKKSITISLEFRSPEETLTDSQVNSRVESIIQTVSRELGAGIR